MGGIEDFRKKVKEMADKARAKAQEEERHEQEPGQSDIDRLKQRLSDSSGEQPGREQQGGQGEEP